MQDEQKGLSLFFAWMAAVVVFLICLVVSAFLVFWGALAFSSPGYGNVALLVLGLSCFGVSIFISVKVFQISMRCNLQATTFVLVSIFTAFLLICGWIQARTLFFSDRFILSVVGFTILVLIFVLVWLRLIEREKDRPTG